MLVVNENVASTFHIRSNEISRSTDSISKDRLKRPISPLLEVGVKKFFDSHM